MIGEVLQAAVTSAELKMAHADALSEFSDDLKALGLLDAALLANQKAQRLLDEARVSLEDDLKALGLLDAALLANQKAQRLLDEARVSLEAVTP